jgi:hypothetical protein
LPQNPAFGPVIKRVYIGNSNISKSTRSHFTIDFTPTNKEFEYQRQILGRGKPLEPVIKTKLVNNSDKFTFTEKILNQVMKDPISKSIQTYGEESKTKKTMSPKSSDSSKSQKFSSVNSVDSVRKSVKDNLQV